MENTITSECPDVAVLADLIAEKLDETAQVEIISHLDHCGNCQTSLQQLAVLESNYLANPPKTAPLQQQEDIFLTGLRQLKVDLMAANDRTQQVAIQPIDQHSFLTHQPADNVAGDYLDPCDEQPYIGKLDRFYVESIIGQGGMGIVFKAFDRALLRPVALKMLAIHFSKNDQLLQRFLREARLAAGLYHPNVVTIHHVDQSPRTGVPFIVMQLVRGNSLQEQLDAGKRFTVREVIRIGAAVAAGLAEAHQNGLIHRDVKPGNILIEQETERVLLTDFGLARAVEDVRITQTGFVAGTPLYMSPEQASGAPLSPASDLFGLGSVLYALLTGKPPFEGSSPFVVLRQVTESQHIPLKERSPEIPAWLSDVIDRLLAKNPDDRLSDCGKLARLLEQELAKLPDNSTPVSLREITRDRRSRKKILLRSLQLVAVAAIFTTLITEITQKTQWTVLGQRGQNLVAVPPAVRNGKDSSPTPKLIVKPSGGAVWAVAFSPKGNLFATGTEDGKLKFWDPTTGNIQGELKSYNSPIWAVGFGPLGEKVAAAADDGTVRLWNVKTSEEEQTLPHSYPVRSMAFSPSGFKVATGTRNGAVTIWDARSGMTQLRTIGHEQGVVLCMAFSTDDKMVASACSDKTVKVWDADNAKLLYTLAGHDGPVDCVAFDPTNKYIATGGWDKKLRIWNRANGELLSTIDVQCDEIWSIGYTPDGHYLFLGGQDGSIVCINAKTEETIGKFINPGGAAQVVTVSKDGKTLAVGSRDGTVRLWEIYTDLPFMTALAKLIPAPKESGSNPVPMQ
ncbi:MAG: serine/threonine-protein kinase [Zavarzinella sp.]